MKTLCLIRHAKSSPANFNVSDFTRPLSESGKNEVVLMGEKIARLPYKFDFFVSSPALRTRQTCEALCDYCKYPNGNICFNEHLYLPDNNAIKKLVTATDDLYSNIVIVTHNPGITEFINSLNVGVKLDNMPTCGIFIVQADTGNWSSFFDSTKQFLFFDYPTKF